MIEVTKLWTSECVDPVIATHFRDPETMDHPEYLWLDKPQYLQIFRHEFHVKVEDCPPSNRWLNAARAAFWEHIRPMDLHLEKSLGVEHPGEGSTFFCRPFRTMSGLEEFVRYDAEKAGLARPKLLYLHGRLAHLITPGPYTRHDGADSENVFVASWLSEIALGFSGDNRSCVSYDIEQAAADEIEKLKKGEEDAVI